MKVSEVDWLELKICSSTLVEIVVEVEVELGNCRLLPDFNLKLSFQLVLGLILFLFTHNKTI